MKYYAVTEDPRELYHYGVKGMKWGQHIFGDKLKSPGYHKAVKKLKSLSAKASKATAKSMSTVGQTVKKSAQQMLYNARAAQQKRFNKAIERSQKRYDKIDQKIENYYANKPVKDAKRQAAVNSVKQGASAVASFVRKAPGQIAYTARKHEENRYQKAVKKAQDRNKLSDALRGLDKEEKLIKQVNRDRKMEELREKHADIMADNDLKTMQKAVRVEKNMPRYYQEARTGQLRYGKLSDEQIGRLQNRLALEANTRRLGSTEEPSWREQKKQARRQGYLQGITKGVSAGMEEVARAGVQYGIRNLANRKKMDAASELKAEREKNANRIKNKKTRSEMREDVKQEAYEAQVKSGVGALHRANLTATKAGRNITAVNDMTRAKQDKIAEDREERKFLMEERHNTTRNERQNRENEEREDRALERAAKMAYEYGYLGAPVQSNKGNNQQGKKNGSQNKFTDADIPKLADYYRQRYVNKKTNQDIKREHDERAKELEKEVQREIARQKIRNEALEDQKRRQQRNEELSKLGEQIIAENERKNLERKIQKTLNKSISNTVISDRPIVSITQHNKDRDERYPRGTVGYADDIGLFIPKRRRRRSDR